MRGTQPPGGFVEPLPGSMDLSTPVAADVIQRMRDLTGATSDIDLGKRLNISRSAPSAWRVRNHVTLDICVDFAAQHHVSLDWLLFGIGVQERTGVRLHPDVAPIPLAHVGVPRLDGFDSTPGPDQLIFPELVVRRHAVKGSVDHLRWMLNPTDALAPRLPKDRVLLVDGSVTQLAEVVDGETYVTRLWGRVNVRRIFGIGPNEFRLRGDREMEDRRDVTGPDYKHLEIGGRVIDVI